MTIFLEIAKHFLLPEIISIRNASAAAEASPLNVTRGFFGLGRNPILSKAKQGVLDGLNDKITNLIEQASDAETRDHLIKLIDDGLTNMANVRRDIEHYPEGQTEARIRSLLVLIDSIFKKLEMLQVLNEPHDQKPLNCFRYYMALYCAQKTVEMHNESILQQLAHDPHFSKARGLSADKEDLIVGGKVTVDGDLTKAQIELCKIKLQAKRDNLENIQLEKNIEVKLFLRNLQLENLDLYRVYGIDPGIPMQYSFFTAPAKLTEIQLGGGFLGECLRKATEEIDKNIHALSVKNGPAAAEHFSS